MPSVPLLSNRALLTFFRTGLAGLTTMMAREMIFLRGTGALNGGIEPGRAWLAGSGIVVDVPAWFHRVLAGYEMAVMIWFVCGLAAGAMLNLAFADMDNPGLCYR